MRPKEPLTTTTDDLFRARLQHHQSAPRAGPAGANDRLADVRDGVRAALRGGRTAGAADAVDGRAAPLEARLQLVGRGGVRAPSTSSGGWRTRTTSISAALITSSMTCRSTAPR